jgi:hypothetical protein
MLSPYTRTRLVWRDGKKVRAHRWLVEQRLGRRLAPTEHVHHINGNPLDNRPENLVVLDGRAHMCLHKQQYPDVKPCANCGQTFTVNPRKRKRNKCCSLTCAMAIRIAGRQEQARAIMEAERRA